MLVHDAARRPISLGQEFARGGEATVFRVETRGYEGQLAKIYTSAPRRDYEKKLSWMVANPPQDPTRPMGHASIAWPLGMLYDNQGRFVGYLMPYIKEAVPLLEVFNPLLRKRTLPGFNWRYLHRTARNLAAALGALHARGYVMGDLHESNFLVTPQTMVTLIDTDSFQVIARHSAKPVIYRCPVGKIEYTPPELQGHSFPDTPRRPEHDSFGLGVLIFQLLMKGSHPFRAQWLGDGDPLPLEEKIRRGCFPYMNAPPCPVGPPRRAPSLEVLHPLVADMVFACFVDGHGNPRWRPTAEDWIEALTVAEAALVTCRNGHYYSKHLSCCPDCSPQPTGRKPRGRARSAARRTRRFSHGLAWLVGRATGGTPRQILSGAVAGATVGAAGGTIFGLFGGGLAGVIDGVSAGAAIWAALWAVLWAIGWWAFGEALGATWRRRKGESIAGVVGVLSGAAIGGGLGWTIGDRGVEGMGDWAMVSPLINLIAHALGIEQVESLLGSVLTGAIGGTLVWASAWAVAGAIGGILGWQSVDSRYLLEGLRRVPGKTRQAAWIASGGLQGAAAGAVVGLAAGAVTGVVGGGLSATADTPLVKVPTIGAGGTLLGATVATVASVRAPFLQRKLGAALEVIGAYAGLVAGLVTAWPGLLVEAGAEMGLASVVEGMAIGLSGGLAFGLLTGALAGALAVGSAYARRV